MVACAVSTGDRGREAIRWWIRLPLCAPYARIQLRRRGSSAVAGGASADPAPPSSRVDPARVKTMGRRQDGGNLHGAYGINAKSMHAMISQFLDQRIRRHGVDFYPVN
uniref:Uncharacterized protein n=1 Tax=Oryza glumipatula TaxID=40148 RepID=A0A0D9ZGC5_9ORYZ